MTKRPASGKAEITDLLTGTPHRLTKQRRLILQKLSGMKKYATAKQLHARLANVQPRIGLATVYRTLEMLRGLGLVATQAQAHGETAYLHCRSGHHHHAVCTRCGRVDDVPCRALPTYARILSHGLRFQLREHQLEFYGVCARCS
jgi:Fur family transcriptional regulator, ferric uptake regulator